MDILDSFTIGIRTKRDAATFRAHEGEPLLYAGLRSGLDLPYECASGTCGTCQAQVLGDAPGAITNLFPGAPGAADIPAGRVLMCQSACHGDVELRMFATLRQAPPAQSVPNHFDCTVRDLRPVARDTYSLSLDTGAPFAFRSGQFVMLRAGTVNGARAYSMTRAHSLSDSIELIIRTKPGGAFSAWLLGARPGDTVRAFGPLGRATLPAEPCELFAIAGGTGAAGILSILEEAGARGDFASHDATFVFGVRTMADAFHLEEMNGWARRAKGRLRVVVALSDADAAGADAYPELRFERGLVLDVARRVLREKTSGPACHLLAGPPVVVDGGIAMLCGEFEVPAASIRYDRF